MRSSPRYQLGLVGACAALLAVSLIRANYPQEQWLQHPPTVLGLATLLLASRNRWLSNAAATCLVAFLMLHIVGARWIYSYVPYEAWCRRILGSGPEEWFGWNRNHYDRFVHLAFGAILVRPIAEIASRFGGASPRLAIILAVMVIVAAGAAYEIFEWLLAAIAAPEYAERYNGQQGDFWDAQKDMALALAGSLATAAVMWIRPNRLTATLS